MAQLGPTLAALAHSSLVDEAEVCDEAALAVVEPAEEGPANTADIIVGPLLLAVQVHAVFAVWAHDETLRTLVADAQPVVDAVFGRIHDLDADAI